MALAIGLMASAQVKIGNNPTAINDASLLELESSTQGLLLPRVALVNTTTRTLVGSASIQGMTVYNTANTGDVTEGLYTHNGTKWVKVGGSPFVSATLTKDATYTALLTTDVTPNNITTITFSVSSPTNFTITDLPSDTCIIPERAKSSARLPSIETPFQLALPEAASFKPDKVLSSVVLPAPFAPMIAASWPCGTLNETLFIALIAP